MKILYYDCFSGMSGDMNLGAMVDIGVDPDYLKDMLNKLSIKDEFHLHISKKQKMGITGTKVDVILNGESHQHKHNQHSHSHEHHNHSNHHKHLHEDFQSHHHKSHHEHRNLGSIRKIIENTPYNENIKSLSLKMFMEVAKAEAKVHGKILEEVHFHEVGAVDSIVDIIGTSICLDYLKVDKIMASSIELGGGFVKCAHGIIPVPAPATVEILKNVPVTTGKVKFETTTPTGAAILKANVNEFSNKLAFNILKTGYGLGTKDFDIPNVVRVYIAELGEENEVKKDFVSENQVIVEANIDDMNPELYDYIEEKLFSFGALDVYKTNILMKKNRPAVKLSVLATPENMDKLKQIIFEETTTLGLREYTVKKQMLKREFEKILTKYGEVDVKKGLLNGKVIKVKPEYDTCKKLAKENNVTIREIYSEIDKFL